MKKIDRAMLPLVKSGCLVIGADDDGFDRIRNVAYIGYAPLSVRETMGLYDIYFAAKPEELKRVELEDVLEYPGDLYLLMPYGSSVNSLVIFGTQIVEEVMDLADVMFFRIPWEGEE